MEQRGLLNESFRIIGISPLKNHAVAKTTKIKAACDKLERSFEKQKEMVKDIFKLAPDWPRAHVAKYFNVSKYMFREARKLAREKGILALPEPKRGKCLSKEVEDSVKLFYEDDKYLRLMPGAKDYVSVAKNVHQQKRLLLCNLKELYQSYKEKFSQHKIGLSKFSELRPKWCVTISSSGTHSVCVCCPPKHKLLMLFAVPSTTA